MFDRILLLLLILLLPLGILASRWTTGELKFGNGMSSEQEKKIEAMINQVSQKPAQPAVETEGIQVTSTIYASDSATLKVSGVAPKTQAFLWVWAASSKAKKEKEATATSGSEPVWKGPLVIWPGAGGTFTAPVDVAEMAGIVEVRLEQDKAVTDVRYDLEQMKPIQ